MKRTRNNYKKPRNPVHTKKEHYYTKDDIFFSRIASILRIPKNKVKDIFSQRSITTIRLNSLKEKPERTKRALEAKGYELEAIPWAKDVYFVLNRDKAEVSQTKNYQNGDFYIQNLSSILATVVLDPKQGKTILDMCAAPGSKTTHIAQMIDNKGVVLANDTEIQRLNSLKNVIAQFGAKCAKPTLSDGADFGKKYPNYFDQILLDAPCSGEGMIYFPGQKPLRFWNIKKIKKCSYIQRDLIESAFKALKPGGTMVYSTCTLEPEENEGIVSYLLDNYTNAKLLDIDIEVKAMKGIPKWSGNVYHRDIEKTMRILPSKEMMGFYIAKIYKSKE